MKKLTAPTPLDSFGVGALIYPALRVFRLNPIFGVAISTIPLHNLLQKFVKLTPVLAKLCGFVLFAGLLALSWYAAEVIVLLGAIALYSEVLQLTSSVKKQVRKARAFRLPPEAFRNGYHADVVDGVPILRLRG